MNSLSKILQHGITRLVIHVVRCMSYAAEAKLPFLIHITAQAKTTFHYQAPSQHC
jgi:hypothetical protein